jgi:hypothetical protein
VTCGPARLATDTTIRCRNKMFVTITTANLINKLQSQGILKNAIATVNCSNKMF